MVMSQMSVHGSCACGNIRYAVNADDLPSHFCHCRMCQIAKGSPVAAFSSVPEVSFQEPMYHVVSSMHLY